MCLCRKGGQKIINIANYITQDERWLTRYNEVVRFIKANHRNPSKHRSEERGMLDWIKVNKKRLNAGVLKPERLWAFYKLLALNRGV